MAVKRNNIEVVTAAIKASSIYVIGAGVGSRSTEWVDATTIAELVFCKTGVELIGGKVQLAVDKFKVLGRDN